MRAHGADPDVFIRSFSARGELGGLSRATRAAVDCFDAAGFDRVVVETVGTGQSETAHRRARRHAHRRLPAGPRRRRPGDQGRHARDRRHPGGQQGRPAARRADGARDARDAGLRRAPAAGAWPPRVVVVEALAGRIDALLEAIDAHAGQVAPGRRLRAADEAGAHPVPARAAVSAGAAGPRRSGARPRECARRRRATASPPTPTAGGSAWPRWPRATACAPPSASRCVAGGPGRAEVAMTVGASHLNFNGGCHGGDDLRARRQRLRPGLELARPGRRRHRRPHHLPGRRRRRRPAGRPRRRGAPRRAGSRVYRIEVVRSGADGGETAVSSFTGTVYIKA